jgi:hypothetical protein
MSTKEAHEELIRQLKEVGESFIKNAKGIVGSDEYLTGLELHVVFDVNDYLPEITLERRFVPERTVERLNERFK